MTGPIAVSNEYANIFRTKLDKRRRWAEEHCTDPLIWADLASAYRAQERYCMADYCEQHALHYVKIREEQERETITRILTSS